MTTIDLKELVSRENERVEWKENVADISELVRTAAAFANDFSNLGGGYIVCGAREIKDSHGFQALDLIGLTAARLQEVQGQLMAHCRDKVDPAIVPLTYEEPVQGDDSRRVLIFMIPATGYAHTYRPNGEESGKYWIRIGKDTREARDGLLRELLVKKGHLPPWDRRPAEQASEADIDLIALRDSYQRMGVWDPQKSLEDYLSTTDSVSPFVPPLMVKALVTGREAHPRNFSVLLFGKEILRHIPGAHVVLSIYRGKDRSEPTAERHEIVGTLIEQTRKVLEQLNAEAYVVYDKASVVPNQTKYPLKALHEAVVNAMVHRDYEIDQPVRVTVFSDRIEIVSPGSLPRALDETRFKTGQAAPFWKNQALAYFFSKLQLAQAEGQGIPTIIRTMQEEGCPPPSFVVEPERITCVLPAHPRHATLRELQAIENKIIIGRNEDARNQLEALLNSDPSNFRALELYCQVCVATDSARRIYEFVVLHSVAIRGTNSSTLLTISETLLGLQHDQDARRLAAELSLIASSRNLEAAELRRAVINLRKLHEDDKALELIESMFSRNPPFQRNASLLQLAGKARIDLAKKCIETAKDSSTRYELKVSAWKLCRSYLAEAERDFQSALEYATDLEREYIERDIEFLAHMQNVSKRPANSGRGRGPSGRPDGEKLVQHFRRPDRRK